MSESIKTPLVTSISEVQQGTAPSPKGLAQQALESAISPVKEAVKEVAETPKQQPPGADRFAALAKKERSIQKQLSEIKAKEAKLQEWEKFKNEASTNPMKALEALGLSYEQITNYILNGQKPTPDLELKAVRDEVKMLKDEQRIKEERARARAKERAEKEYQSTLQEFKQEVGSYLTSNKDNYELTNMYNGEEIVIATIEQHFEATKKLMSVKEASDLVEAYFEEQVKAAQKTKKFQNPDQGSKKDGQGVSKAGSKEPTPTLNNTMTSSAPSLLPAKTEADRLSRAMAALDKR